MSYQRNYNATLSGTVSGTYTYPASESGGAGSMSLNWSEDVSIDILVDTSSFDYGIASLKHHVDGLTGAVVTTETLHIEEKAQSASDIGESVTKGFFNLIRSEISQQVVGLKSRVDSLILKLNDMRLASQLVKQAMEQDYGRITDRYSSIFEELDRELAARIATLDDAAYAFRREASSQGSRSLDTTLSTVPTVFGREVSQAQTALLAGIMHARMNSLLQLAVAYLVSERQTSRSFSRILSDWAVDDSTTHSVPVAYVEAGDPAPRSVSEVIVPSAQELPFNNDRVKNTIIGEFQSQKRSWKPMGSEERAQIERFLVPLIDAVHTSSAEHDDRVRQLILRLWGAHKPETLKC